MSTQPTKPAAPNEAGSTSRWELIRDVAVFQLKLGVDALRDIALVPVSLVAGTIDLLTSGDRPGHLFYDVLHFGQRSEHWINLFGEADRTEASGDAHEDIPTVDAFVERVEGMIVEQFERGGITATAKDAIDRSLDAFTGSKTSPGQLRPPAVDDSKTAR